MLIILAGLKLQRRLETQVAVIELDLSGNPLGADSAEALAEAATCDRHKALAFQARGSKELFRERFLLFELFALRCLGDSRSCT